MGSTSPSSSNFTLDSQSNANFGATANWNIDGSLIIKVQNDVLAGQSYKVAVVLTNQEDAQDAQLVSVKSTGIDIDWQIAQADPNQIPQKVLSRMCVWVSKQDSMDCGKGDAMPMKIYQPQFLVASVRQSTDWPGATNELTVDLVANVDLSGERLSNLTISKMDGLHDKMPTAPFIAGDVRKGAYCGEDPDTASNLFVMFSVQNVRERFGQMDPDNADNFACVKVVYKYDNRTYRKIQITEKGRVVPKARPIPLNCTANGTWFNTTSNQTINCTLYNMKLETTASTSNCTNGKWFNATSNQTINCTINKKNPWNESQLVNTSEWFVSSTEWQYYDGSTWKKMLPVPTDLLVANVTKGVRGMEPEDPSRKVDLIAGIAVGLIGSRSDTSFSRGTDKNVKIMGDFLTPPLVALTSKEGSSRTIECRSDSGRSPWCSISFESVGLSAKISIEVLNIEGETRPSW